MSKSKDGISSEMHAHTKEETNSQKNCLAHTHPDLVKEWHPTKNGDLKPEDVSYGSSKKVWWMLPYDDPKTGKHFDFEWEARVANRTILGRGCPYLTNTAVWPTFNDLATTHEELARQWHPTKNGDLKPSDVTCGMRVEVWWYLPYDDPRTGKHFDFEWKNTINDRVSKSIICPYLTGKSVWVTFNDLKTLRPDLALEWHPTKNGDLRPEDVTCGSHKKVWWLLPYDDPKTGKHFDFEWESTVYHRTKDGRNCPYLSNQKVFVGFNDLVTDNDELAKLWHPTKNANLKPTDVTAGSNKKVWWYLSYDDHRTGKHFDFEWEASVKQMSRGAGCPYLSGRAIWIGFNDLATTHEDLAKQWHPTKNGTLKPTDVTYGSRTKVWWQVAYEGEVYEWVMSICNRTFWGAGCPALSGSYLEKAVYNILRELKIEFEPEQIFDKFISEQGKYYRYDCYLPAEQVIIECDGEQHFMSVEQFGGEKAFKERVKSDNKKNDYSFKNEKPMLRIPYTYLKRLNELEKLVIDFVETKTIPQEIIDFYSQFEFSNYPKCIEQYYGSIEEIEAA